MTLAAAFNYNFDSLSNDDNPIAKSYQNLLYVFDVNRIRLLTHSNRGDSMTRTSSAILGDALLRYIPQIVFPLFDYLPTKAMKKISLNSKLVNGLGRDLVTNALSLLDAEVDTGKDILSQIGA